MALADYAEFRAYFKILLLNFALHAVTVAIAGIILFGILDSREEGPAYGLMVAMFWPGVVQIAYAPLVALWFWKKEKRDMLKRWAILCGVLFLLNGACYGVLFLPGGG